MAFLHYQERKLRNRAKSADGWSDAYYIPGFLGSLSPRGPLWFPRFHLQGKRIGASEPGGSGWQRPDHG